MDEDDADEEEARMKMTKQYIVFGKADISVWNTDIYTLAIRYIGSRKPIYQLCHKADISALRNTHISALKSKYISFQKPTVTDHNWVLET